MVPLPPMRGYRTQHETLSPQHLVQIGNTSYPRGDVDAVVPIAVGQRIRSRVDQELDHAQAPGGGRQRQRGVGTRRRTWFKLCRLKPGFPIIRRTSSSDLERIATPSISPLSMLPRRSVS